MSIPAVTDFHAGFIDETESLLSRSIQTPPVDAELSPSLPRQQIRDYTTSFPLEYISAFERFLPKPSTYITFKRYNPDTVHPDFSPICTATETPHIKRLIMSRRTTYTIGAERSRSWYRFKKHP